MKKIVLVVLIILIAFSAFGRDLISIEVVGDFYARMPKAEAFALVGDRELIESYSGVDYTFYDYGDLKLYISEGVLTGVKVYELEGKIFGHTIGDEFDYEAMGRQGIAIVYYGGNAAFKYTNVRFFFGNRIYSPNRPNKIVYAIEVYF